LLGFYCPGCKENHVVRVESKDNLPCWGFNGNFDKPTFTPSILIRSGHYIPELANQPCWCTYNKEHPNEKAPFECSVCHSFVTDGNIQFLSDCTHDLKGQTVALEEGLNDYRR
jgi:hypothetical protein